MKKSIYYFLMMLCMTLVNTSCSNDDGETPDYTVTLTTPEYASEAKAMSGFNIDATHTLGAPKLTAVHITESGEVVFELGDGEEYIVEGIESVNDGTYVLSGNRGTITVSSAANAKMSKELEKAQAVTDTKIEELTREVREHNNFAKRVPVLEEKAKVADHRISDLEHINQKD